MTLLVIQYTTGDVEAYPDARFVRRGLGRWRRTLGILRWQQGDEWIRERRVADIVTAYRITDDGSEYGIGLINLIGDTLRHTIATYPKHRRTPEAATKARKRKQARLARNFQRWADYKKVNP